MISSQLQVFICVADCGSFTRASEKLFISSTSMMKKKPSIPAKRQKTQEQAELKQENKRLEEENLRLRMENDYLKKLSASIQNRGKSE